MRAKGAPCSLTSPMRMSRIESRPTNAARWSYVFYIDVDGHADDEPLKSALAEMRDASSLLRVLGSYPRAIGRGRARTDKDA